MARGMAHDRPYPGFDADDGQIVQLVVQERWKAQDGLWWPTIRQVQDNVRMIEGRHWDVWMPSQQRFVDITSLLTEKDREFFQRPVFNYVGDWFVRTHGKLTEKPPVVSFLPATGDQKDADLAEVMDAIHKYLWFGAEMEERVSELVGMVLAASSGVVKSWWNPDLGLAREIRGPAFFPLFDEFGNAVVQADGQLAQGFVERAPYQLLPDGTPVPMIEPMPGGGYREIAGAAVQYEGGIDVEILSPLDVRTEIAKTPWHRRRWYVERRVLPVREIYERYGVRVTPGGDDQSTALQIADQYTGFGGPMARHGSSAPTLTDNTHAVIYEMWEQPREECRRGRHTVVTDTLKLSDGPNPYGPTFRPYHMAEFTRVPGRFSAKSPIETISPINRVSNRGWSQILEHRNKMTNPFYLVDRRQIQGKIKNSPGQMIDVDPTYLPNSPPLDVVQPPPLPQAVYHVQALLREELRYFGSLEQGSSGAAATRQPSGELVRELRANDDRYLAGPAASIVRCLGRVVQVWPDLVKFALESGNWTEGRVIRISGEESAIRFRSIRSEMFEGQVHVRPDIESLLPEGRQERQQRVDWWFMNELLTPAQYWELIQHPHLAAAARPGGVHRRMAEIENMRMARGHPTEILAAHNDEIHIDSHEKFAASPEFQTLPEMARALILQHIGAHNEQLAEKAEAAAAIMPPTEEDLEPARS